MRAGILAGVSIILTLGACASAGETPAWLAEREAAAPDSFPDLQSVPRTSDANTDAAYWERLQAELSAAGREVRANPRSTPATPEQDPSVFLEDARRELEETRLSHEPN